jgi:DNA-binding response OmpR family regulator
MARILLIEDRTFITKILEIVVKRDGHTIIAASTGGMGLQLLKQESPDLVITDIGLPDMSGFDVIRAIKAETTVPVIVLTSGTTFTTETRLPATLAPEDYLKTALSLGAAAAFLKPVSSDDLMNAIHRHVKRVA